MILKIFKHTLIIVNMITVAAAHLLRSARTDVLGKFMNIHIKMLLSTHCFFYTVDRSIVRLKCLGVEYIRHPSRFWLTGG